MRYRKSIQQITLITVLLIGTFGTAASTASAQGNSEAGSTLVNYNSNINVNKSANTVSGTYKLKMESPHQNVKEFTGSIWSFPKRSISNFSATINNKPISEQISKENENIQISLPTSDIQLNEIVTIKFRYTVQNAQNNLKVPLFVPTSSTSAKGNAVNIKTALPPGQQLQGDVFPSSVKKQNGNIVTFQLIHVPGFIYMKYGQDSGSFFTVGHIMTIIGVLIIVGFVGSFFYYDREFIEGDTK